MRNDEKKGNLFSNEFVKIHFNKKTSNSIILKRSMLMSMKNEC